MKFLLLSVFFSLYVGRLYAQDSVYFSLSEATQYKDYAKILVYNRNYQLIDTIPNDINNLYNLEELIFLPHYYFKEGESKLVYMQTWDSASNQFHQYPQVVQADRILSLPNSLDGLKSLDKLVLSYNSLESLPQGLDRLAGLKELYLDYTNLEFDEIWEKIKNLPNLHVLSLKGLGLDRDKMRVIREKWPHIDLITIDEEHRKRDVWFTLQRHDTYWTFFNGDIMSEYFYRSLPNEIRNHIDKYGDYKF